MGYTGEEMTWHGFRSLASTRLNEHGWNADWIESQLAHGERDKVRAAYNHAKYLPDRKRMMQWWADYLDELKEGGKVDAKPWAALGCGDMRICVPFDLLG